MNLYLRWFFQEYVIYIIPSYTIFSFCRTDHSLEKPKKQSRQPPFNTAAADSSSFSANPNNFFISCKSFNTAMLPCWKKLMKYFYCLDDSYWLFNPAAGHINMHRCHYQNKYNNCGTQLLFLNTVTPASWANTKYFPS